VAEVSVEPNGQVRVHRVVCALDCGTVVNPHIVEAQIEGAILFGLSAALSGEITFSRGRCQQSNFHDAPLLRFSEAPQSKCISSRMTGRRRASVSPVCHQLLQR
jgi:isoquinoline 1-oxidoreductase beta subunit